VILLRAPRASTSAADRDIMPVEELLDRLESPWEPKKRRLRVPSVDGQFAPFLQRLRQFGQNTKK
jgi:hypothetical protein